MFTLLLQKISRQISQPPVLKLRKRTMLPGKEQSDLLIDNEEIHTRTLKKWFTS